MLEALQAGIARQLAVLEDASLTGTGQSSADVLGVPSTGLAEKLTGHLLWEIVVHGSRDWSLRHSHWIIGGPNDVGRCAYPGLAASRTVRKYS